MLVSSLTSGGSHNSPSRATHRIPRGLAKRSVCVGHGCDSFSYTQYSASSVPMTPQCLEEQMYIWLVSCLSPFPPVLRRNLSYLREAPAFYLPASHPMIQHNTGQHPMRFQCPHFTGVATVHTLKRLTLRRLPRSRGVVSVIQGELAVIRYTSE